MPWTSRDAKRHQKKVGKSKKRQRQWAHIANRVLRSSGDEGKAIRQANAVTGRASKRRRSRR